VCISDACCLPRPRHMRILTPTCLLMHARISVCTGLHSRGLVSLTEDEIFTGRGRLKWQAASSECCLSVCLSVCLAVAHSVNLIASMMTVARRIINSTHTTPESCNIGCSRAASVFGTPQNQQSAINATVSTVYEPALQQCIRDCKN
jgi:hypothetical protein